MMLKLVSKVERCLLTWLLKGGSGWFLLLLCSCVPKLFTFTLWWSLLKERFSGYIQKQTRVLITWQQHGFIEAKSQQLLDTISISRNYIFGGPFNNICCIANLFFQQSNKLSLYKYEKPDNVIRKKKNL